MSLTGAMIGFGVGFIVPDELIKAVDANYEPMRERDQLSGSDRLSPLQLYSAGISPIGVRMKECSSSVIGSSPFVVLPS